MHTISRMLGGIEQGYLLRAYLIGCAFFAFVMVMFFGNDQVNAGSPWVPVIFAAVNTALFPFAKLVWDRMRDLVLGNNIVWMNALFLFCVKWIINGTLWVMAVFVAPIGLLYLWIRTRRA